VITNDKFINTRDLPAYMSSEVVFRGFRKKEHAELELILTEFEKYHNRRYHRKGRELFMEKLPEGHSGTILYDNKKPLLVIPLYTDEPVSHAYDTIIDVIHVMQQIDPEYDKMPRKITYSLT